MGSSVRIDRYCLASKLCTTLRASVGYSCKILSHSFGSDKHRGDMASCAKISMEYVKGFLTKLGVFGVVTGEASATCDIFAAFSTSSADRRGCLKVFF